MTDISLPVPQRVALGLSSIGLSTTLTLFIELAIATLLLKVIVVEVIRELIVFAAVALVVDYGLEMTFFTTILSIDIQRLEVGNSFYPEYAMVLTYLYSWLICCSKDPSALHPLPQKTVTSVNSPSPHLSLLSRR